MFIFFSLIGSIFINPDKIINLESTNWAFFEIFTAFNTCSIMFTRHINTIFIIFTTNNTSIYFKFLTYISCFNCTYISLTGSNFKNSFITNFKWLTILTFIWKPHPCPICCTHIFNKEFVFKWENSCMCIWKMLVFREVK